MEFLHKLIDLLRHLGEDDKWRAMVDYVGLHNLYIVLFAIVFCETGLVIWPFLPGDSLIFAVGAIGGREIGIDLMIIGPLLVCAALLGDNVNYWLGRKLGPAIFKREDASDNFPPSGPPASAGGTPPPSTPPKKKWTDRLLNQKHLTQAHSFYETYGAKTIILARFVPIVRTFAPFVAGIGKMNYAKFLFFSVVGAIAWVSICLAGGYYLGSRPLFKKHFELVVMAIIVISLIPMAVEVLKARKHTK